MAPTANPSLTSLLSKASLDDHEQLLQASEAALKTSKSDSQAQNVKAIALLKLERYDEAVKFIESVGSALKESTALGYAYGLYRSGRLEDAAQVASTIEGQRGSLHVEAQARYRLGEAEETTQIYKKIRQQQVPSEEHDLRINQGAIDALGQWSGIAGSFKKPGREDLEAFETAYNAACGSIAKGELAQAEVLLKRAKELCRHSEDLTEEQKKEELLPILVQQAYVLFRLGKTAEAEAMAEQVNIDDIDDLATRKIAANNSLLNSKAQSNPFLAHKIFNSTPRVPDGDKLFSYQSIPLASNEKTIDLQSHKFNGLINSARKQLQKYPDASTDPNSLMISAFEAAAHARNEIGKAAIKLVLPQLEKRPNDIGLIMTLVQMYSLTGNTTTAIELVESLFKRLEASMTENEQSVRYHPGLISILVSLYRLQGRRSHVRRELAKAASYWRHRSKPPVTLLRAAGISLLESPASEDVSEASEIFSKLFEQQPHDKATIAGYIASHAVSDPQSVKELATKLTPVSKLIGSVDIDALEAAGIPQSSNAIAIAAAASTGRISRKRAADKDDPSRPKRIRRSRLPKNYDAASNSKPDPERWLPMRDRSYYRAPKSKKKGRKGDDRTQGGNVNEDLDVSKQSQSKGGELVGGSGGGGGGKKKKGKGKR